MKIKVYLMIGILLFLIGFILIGLSFIEARELNDPMVLGDEIPVFSDGGENIPKNKSEPVVKNVEPPQPKITTVYNPPLEMLNLLGEFTNKYGGPQKIKWNEKYDTVKSLRMINYNTGSELNTEEEIDRVSRLILEDSKDLFGIDDVNNLIVRTVYGIDSFPTIKYYQTYNGIPVYRGYVGVGFKSDGKLHAISSRYYPISLQIITPKISEKQAIEIAKDLYDPEYNIDGGASLIILPYENFQEGSNETYLTWLVNLGTSDPWISDEVYIDALTGEVLHKQSRIKSISESDENMINRSNENHNPTIVFLLLAIFLIIISIILFIKKKK